MPRESIEQVTAGNNPPGMFAGGYIYNIKFDIGYSQNLDKVILSVVDGKEQKLGSKIESIRIGSASFLDCYLIAYEENKTPGQKICNYTFTNRSAFLDKIFVGLLRRHCFPDINGCVGLSTGEKAVEIKAKCPCNGATKEVSGSVIVNGLYSGFCSKGGMLCMGEEEPPENGDCDIPEVRYSFGQFIQALQTVENADFYIDLQASGYSEYKVNYTGTAREVLSNICRDIAADFYFDWTRNVLVIYDLSYGISSLPDIPEDHLSSSSKSKNIENTYETQSAQFGFTPGGLVSSQYSYSNSLLFTSNIDYVTSSDLTSEEQSNLIGAILGKIDANARKLYCIKKGAWERIGLIDMGVNIDADYIFENGFDVRTYIDFHKKFKEIGAKPYFKIFIEDTKLETYWQSKEEAIFNSIGRYFYSRDPSPVNYDLCLGKGSKIKASTSYDPEIQYYGNRIYFIEKEPKYCPAIEDIYIGGNLEDFFPVYMDYAGQVRLAILNAARGIGERIEAMDGRILLALVPDPDSISLGVEFNKLNSANNTCEPRISDGLFINRTIPKDQTEDPCKGPCASSAQETLCKNNKDKECNLTGATIVPKPGHVDNKSSSMTITYNGSSIDIILPVREPFYGIETVQGEVTDPFESAYINPGTPPIILDRNNIIPMKSNIVVDDVSGGKINASIAQTVTQPEEILNVKVIGIKNALNLPLNPSEGLSSFSMYIDENGSFADLVYRTRAPQLPSQEVALQKIRPNKVSIRK
jgi:hypothetical protein